jgi:cytochrome b6-f complex iron-sulfur subunit
VSTVRRRDFLSWVVLAWAAFVAAIATAGTATLRFMFPNVLFEPPTTFEAGYPNEIQVGEVDERFKQTERIWLVREPGGIYALLAICTHLGCTPNWLQEEQKFKCPCHGSGYYKSGINFEGPTPRPLERVAIRLADDGQILVDKGVTFRYEKGEWNDPRAYLRV